MSEETITPGRIEVNCPDAFKVFADAEFELIDGRIIVSRDGRMVAAFNQSQWIEVEKVTEKRKDKK